MNLNDKPDFRPEPFDYKTHIRQTPVDERKPRTAEPIKPPKVKKQWWGSRRTLPGLFS